MKSKSFTLIELLVVIVIIGILAGLIMISTSSSIDKANFAKAQAFSSTVQNELLSNLVSEWTFDNASNLGEDTWGNNDGALSGNPQTQAKCVFNECLKFDGDGDYLSIVTNMGDKLDFRDSMTFSLWLNPASTGLYIFAKNISGGYEDQQYAAAFENNTVRFILSGNSSLISSSNSVPYNKWTFVVGTWNGSKRQIYINGQKDKEDSFSTAPSFKQNLTIGFRAGGSASHYLNGVLDDVRFYNTGLQLSQIKQNYIAGLNSLLSKGSISKEEYNERINELAYEQ
jgi:prepilin-type N-terminal cleavage/methylation domain-containing protein